MREQRTLQIQSTMCNDPRDGSACTTLKRVPGQDGKTVDEWMEFYIKSEEENEFYLRNKQVHVHTCTCDFIVYCRKICYHL